MDCCLSEHQKLFIRSNYNGLIKTVKLTTLIPSLQEKQFFDKNELEKLQTFKRAKRLEYLVFDILLQHGTRRRLRVLCDCLSECEQKEAIKYLKNSKDGARDSSDEEVEDNDPEEEVKAAVGAAKITKTTTNASSNPDKVSVASKNLDEADGVKVTTQRPDMKAILRSKRAFISYNQKNPRKGLCVIFSLFTEDMPGYLIDKENLQDFFKNKLKYEVKTYDNLTRVEFLAKLIEVQRSIEEHGEYGKLVIVVLSHGQNDGIMTCADDEGFLEETIDDKPVLITIDEIVDTFKHDKTSSLKERPKLFLFQNCRGREMVQTAGNTSTNPANDDDEEEPDFNFRSKCPIDGDIMICSATTKNHPSLVNDLTGSWFIQKTVDIFNHHYQDEHVYDMMTVVNMAVAELRGKLLDKNQKIKAVQMPCIFSTYRKKFYLDTPPKKV